MLETDRLRLRPLTTADAVLQRELWTERDHRVPAHRRIDADGHPTVADLEARIGSGDHGRSLGLLAVELAASCDVIGYCGLIDSTDGAADEPELAYELLRRHWGRGYATEAGRAVLGWADAAGVERVWAGVRDWNAASRRVLAKLGFVETGRVHPDAVHGDSIVTMRAAPPR